ncbi:Elongation factor 1-gamma 1 [Acorus calamus]|uniref:Elongation factor 1-gamma 1 n=1 Tax=Acorus calamus TaxID=4465 RepID=A0AAV9E3Z2_ACOCL|nr:Elongation factor 1-gamma 1 [Acorus calamus]
MGVSNKTPEFLQMNPIGKVPVLETPEGPIFESNAIARYGRWFYPRIGYGLYVPPVEEAAIAALKRALGALNTYLASNTYLVGHAVTLADIVMGCNLFLGFKMIMTKNFTSEFPHVERICSTCSICQEACTGQGFCKPKEPVKPKIEAKKEQPKKDAPKKVEENLEEEEAPKPKAKNPLDLLPPSKMILDDWKRLYSNTKTNFREIAIKGFWDMYDPEGYSLWFCDYKYNDENTVSFVTLNKVGGFLQRMDLCRKYAFGKMLIIGSNPPYKVRGLWLFRGTEIPQFVLEECYDMELYEWKKADISDEAQKELVNAMIEDQEPFEGEALLDAKCFK